MITYWTRADIMLETVANGIDRIRGGGRLSLEAIKQNWKRSQVHYLDYAVKVQAAWHYAL